MTQRPTLKGVVFDLDGTLAKTDLDIAALYKRTGVDMKEDILQVLADMPDREEAAKKWAIVEEMEEEARLSLTPMLGAKELVAWLSAHQIPTALVTRNTVKTCTVLSDMLLPHKFEVVIGRDSETDSSSVVMPNKPDPALFHHIAAKMSVDPADMIMVGDSPANDIAFGKAAGAATALLDSGRRYVEDGKSSVTADMVVEKLMDLPRQLWGHFDIPGDLGTNMPLKKYDIPEATSAVTMAAKTNDMLVLQASVAASLHVPDESGNTALIWAAEAGNIATVEFLLASVVAEGNVHVLNHRGYLGSTALCRAARLGHVGVLKLLIQAGADMDIPNDKLQYPLHFAAYKQKEECVVLLLESGVNTNSLDRKGRVPAQDTKSEKIRDIILAAMQ
jgi:HAD superfamily hydrolase (TIGR01549 family)